MKGIIKKLLVTSLLMMLTTTISSSSITSTKTENDSIVYLTPIQLRETNLIFAEHNKLLTENKLLRNQINNYKEDNNLLIKTDSVRIAQLSVCDSLNQSLENSLKKKNKALFFWKVGGITVSVGLLIFLLLK